MTRFRTALDTSAVLAYAHDSVQVGEVLVELVDEQVAFAVPALALLEAAQHLGGKPDQQRMLGLLTPTTGTTPQPQ